MGGGRGYPDAEESRCEQCYAVCRQHAEVKGTNSFVADPNGHLDIGKEFGKHANLRGECE
jgi:hypothetical protein